MNLRAGDILLAEPFMKDPNFKRSVVLLCDHNEDGTFGLVLNRKLEFTVEDVLPEFPVSGVELYYGGPVSPDTLHFVHTCGELLEGSVELHDRLFWSGNFEQLKLLLEKGTVSPDQFRFFIGYSGWGGGQLEEEMETNSWIVARGFQEIFVPEKELWHDILNSMGGEYRFVSTFPEDPQLN